MTLKPDAEGIIDPYNHKARWGRAKGKPGKGVSPQNAKIILDYLDDMEQGVNIGGSTKGARSYTRLLTLKSRMDTLARLLQEHAKKTLTQVTEAELANIFTAMRNGTITRTRGEGAYRSTGEYVVTIKSFWHWHQKRERKKGNRIDDITVDLDSTDDKPKFVYLDENDVRKLADNARPEYRVLIWFLYDTGIRTGNELHNVQRKDIHEDLKEGYLVLSVKDEASKTYGRDIKLLLCSDSLKRYIEDMKPEQHLFSQSSAAMNRTLKRLALKVFGTTPNKKPRAKPYHRLTSYDFRHSSACYWLPRYPTESALMYRFGWTNSRMISYYTEFMGMRDTITQADLIDPEAKDALRKDLERQQQENTILREQMKAMNNQMLDVLKRVGTYEKALKEAGKLVRKPPRKA